MELTRIVGQASNGFQARYHASSKSFHEAASFGSKPFAAAPGSGAVPFVSFEILEISV
jgi:hypothetical protein